MIENKLEITCSRDTTMSLNLSSRRKIIVIGGILLYLMIVESAKRVPAKGIRIVLLPEAWGRAEDRRAKSLVGGGTGRGIGSAGPQRRRQDHDDEDHHRRGSTDEGQGADQRTQH